jgi:hypothetical protein
MRKLVLAVAAVAALAATPALAGNLLVNGSFENDLTGWTVGGVSGDGFPPSVIPYCCGSAFGETVPPDNAAGNPGFDAVGDHGAYFVADLAHPQTLTQTVSIVSGTNYTFGFDVYLPQNGFNNEFDATLSATVGGDQFASFAASTMQPVTWTHFSSGGTAGSTGPVDFVFAFNSFGAPAKDFVVDRVYFATTADARGGVPEPASWAMMLVGFGGLGAVLRRRRAATALVAA